jgi:hypothetical protein
MLGYNLIVYPLCVIWLCALVMPILRSIWRSCRTAEENALTRRRLVAALTGELD